ncbi:hypothetical protein B0H14DRAFT_1511187 [Mycena olivaceomarginata]|nr:hypothetical protein B0H14DRAFT_1511187 [Mycena olivaceomarginata]
MHVRISRLALRGAQLDGFHFSYSTNGSPPSFAVVRVPREAAAHPRLDSSLKPPTHSDTDTDADADAREGGSFAVRTSGCSIDIYHPWRVAPSPERRAPHRLAGAGRSALSRFVLRASLSPSCALSSTPPSATPSIIHITLWVTRARGRAIDRLEPSSIPRPPPPALLEKIPTSSFSVHANPRSCCICTGGSPSISPRSESRLRRPPGSELLALPAPFTSTAAGSTSAAPPRRRVLAEDGQALWGPPTGRCPLATRAPFNSVRLQGVGPLGVRCGAGSTELDSDGGRPRSLTCGVWTS